MDLRNQKGADSLFTALEFARDRKIGPGGKLLDVTMTDKAEQITQDWRAWKDEAREQFPNHVTFCHQLRKLTSDFAADLKLPLLLQSYAIQFLNDFRPENPTDS